MYIDVYHRAYGYPANKDEKYDVSFEKKEMPMGKAGGAAKY